MEFSPKYFISSTDRFRICDVEDSDTMQDVAEKAGVSLEAGHGFYQVGSKKEDVGPNKEIVLISKKYPNKGTANAKKARELLGLGEGKIQVKDSTSDKFWIFVQSTSKNRKLTKGTRCLLRVSGVQPAKKEPGATSETKRSIDELDRQEDLQPTTKKLKKEIPETESPPPPSAAEASSPVPDLSSVEYGSFPFELAWKTVHRTLWVMDTPKLPGSPRIIGFDMDSTLIEVKSKAKFAQNRNDWKWWHPDVVPILKQKQREGYKIVVFSNQAGVEKKNTNPNDITGKILDLTEALGFPIQAAFAAGFDHFRKPSTTMWDYVVQHCNKGVAPDLAHCLYVGDAAGRPKDWKKGAKRDFGDSDRAFASNVGVKFMTPEMFFLNDSAPPMTWRTAFDPAEHLAKLERGPTSKEFEGSSVTKPHPEMVIFVGSPASGKSSFVKARMEAYEWINRDTLKTPAKCLKATDAALKAGVSIVIDNTSPTVDARSAYVKLAKKYGVPVRCFRFTTDRALAKHLNWVRVKQTKGERRRIPDVAFNQFFSKLREPTMSEGFDEICKINFVPSFKNTKERKMFLERT